MRALALTLQEDIASAYERLDGHARAEKETWTRAEGGGGTMRILRGERIEKAGVMVSAVWGERSPATAGPFFATGVSTIAHAANPHAPTAHMNVRYFEERDGRWWFGGGMDLTPMGFPYEEDTAHFHRIAREAVEAVDPSAYPRYKAWADEYFFVKHRGRARGVGGVFFDERATERERDFALARSVGERYLDAYAPLLAKRLAQPFTAEERERQLEARGVYAEFNLAYDRGTRFGFESGGNVKAILASLPPLVKW